MNAIEKYAAKKKLAKGLLDLLSRGKHYAPAAAGGGGLGALLASRGK